MKTMLLAFLICVIAAVLTFFLLDLVGVSNEISKMLSVAVLGAFPKLRESLEAHYKEKDPTSLNPEVVALSKYSIHPGLSILYTTIVGFSTALLAGALAVIVHISAGAEIVGGNVMSSVAVISLFTLMPVLYLAGRWIGRRCFRYTFLAAVATGVLVRTLGTAFDAFIVSAEDYKQIFDEAKSIEWFSIQILFGSLLFSVVLLVGAYMGRRQRLTHYFTYLLTRLTPASRNALVEIAYEEAMRIREAESRKTPTKSEA